MAEFLKTISIAALVAMSGPALAQDDTGTGDQAQEAQSGQNGTGAASSGSDGAAAGSQSSSDSGEDGGGSSDMVAPSGSDDLSMGEPAGESEGPGSSYVAETHGAWEQRCVRTEEGADPCQLYQLLRDESGNAVAEMSVFPLPEGREAAAGSTIITPLETLLTRNIRLSVDGGETRRYPFEFCTRQGCIARVGFTDAEVGQFKRGVSGTLLIVPAAAPDQEISLKFSLSGFTAGYEAVAEANAKAADAPQQ